MDRVPRRVAAIAAASVAGLAVAFVGWYRVTMHNFPWQGDPARLSICGRNYYPEAKDVSTGELRADGVDSRRLFAVYRAPIIVGPQVYADTSPAQRAAPRPVGEPCAGALVIEDAHGRYLVYRLSGGP